MALREYTMENRGAAQGSWVVHRGGVLRSGSERIRAVADLQYEKGGGNDMGILPNVNFEELKVTLKEFEREYVDEFIEEILAALESLSSDGDAAHIRQVLNSWSATAEAYRILDRLESSTES